MQAPIPGRLSSCPLPTSPGTQNRCGIAQDFTLSQEVGICTAHLSFLCKFGINFVGDVLVRSSAQRSGQERLGHVMPLFWAFWRAGTTTWLWSWAATQSQQPQLSSSCGRSPAAWRTSTVVVSPTSTSNLRTLSMAKGVSSGLCRWSASPRAASLCSFWLVLVESVQAQACGV